MNEHAMRDAYDATLRARDGATPAADLPLDRLAALVERDGSEAERLRALDVAMSSAEGRREFEMAYAAARAARPPARQSVLVRWMAIAATLVVAVGVGSYWRAQSTPLPVADVARGSSTVHALIAPRGDDVAARGARFVWHRVDGAQSYSLVVVDGVGNEVFASSAPDTMLALPDSVMLRVGATYSWWVEARMPDGSQRATSTESIRVTRP